jgi:restriction modification system DNA specificity domain protein
MRPPQLADNLRRAVLQAAIEGKLNDRTNENARDLLAAIQAEKTALQKTGKLKKNKPLAAIDEAEIPFTIPENWIWVRLGELAQVLNGDRGKNYPGKNFWISEGKPFINAGSLNNSVLDNSGFNYISEDRYTLLRSGFIRTNDFLYCLRGSLGKFSLNKDFNEGVIGSSLCIIRVYNEEIIPFFFYYLQTDLAQEVIKLVSNGTAQPNLSAENVRDFLIPLPPLTEQQQIVEKLNRLLAEIDELKAQEQALLATQNAFPKKLRAALLQAAVQGELNERTDENARDLLAAIQTEKTALQKAGKLKKDKPLAAISEEEIPFAIPENWVWVRLGDVTDYGIGKQTPPERIPMGALVIEMEDIEKDTYRLLEKHRKREPKSSKNSFFAGDILYGKLRPYLKKAVVADEDGFCSTEIIPFSGLGKIDSQYLLFCMTSPFMLSNINQLTYGMDMPRLGTNDARNLLIPLPPLTEQQQIVAKLEALLAEIEILENAS